MVRRPQGLIPELPPALLQAAPLTAAMSTTPAAPLQAAPLTAAMSTIPAALLRTAPLTEPTATHLPAVTAAGQTVPGHTAIRPEEDTINKQH